jgi:tRNA A-37 threonylcarbamoyl transferase component Bud32
MLEYVEPGEAISRIGSPSARKLAVGAALRCLQNLHEIRLAHGDIAERNVILRRGIDNPYSAVWIDFSTSVLNVSDEVMLREWEEALHYFSRLVKLCNQCD